MNETKWLLSPPNPLQITGFLESNHSIISNCLKDMGVPYKTAQYIPFDLKRYDEYEDGENVVCYGEIGFIDKVIREKHNWNLMCENHRDFDCYLYYVDFDEHLLNYDWHYVSIEEFFKRKDYIFETFGKDGVVFVRPDKGDKLFNAGCIGYSNVEAFFSMIDKEELLMISQPKKIKEEYRFFVYDNTIITGSQYRDENGSVRKRVDSGSVVDYTQEVLDDVRTHLRLFVIDICKNENDDFYVLELNSPDSSGFYACDVKKIVDTVNDYCMQKRK